MNNIGKNIAIWLIIGLVLMTVFNQFSKKHEPQSQMAYSEFIDEVRQGRVASVEIEGHPLRGQMLRGKRSDGSTFNTLAPYDPGMVADLLKNNVRFSAKPEEEQSLFMQVFISWFPMLLLIGVWIFFMRQMQGGAREVRSRSARAVPVCWMNPVIRCCLPMLPDVMRPRKKYRKS